MCRIFIVLLFLLAFSSQNHAQSKDSTSKIDSLKIVYNNQQNDAEKVKVLLNAPTRIDEYYLKPPQIFNLYTDGLQAAKRLNDKRSIMLLLVEMAYIQMYPMADETQAYNLYIQALSYAKELKDYYMCANICFEIAAINEHQNLQPQATEYLLKSIEYCRKTPKVYMKSYRWLIYEYLLENNLEKALKYGYEFVAYVNDRNASTELRVMAYGNLHGVLKKIPRKRQEQQAFQAKLITLINQIKIIDESYYIYLDDIAAACYEAGQYELAIEVASQISKASKVNSHIEIVRMLCYEVIAKAYERLGNYKKGHEYYKKYAESQFGVYKNMLRLETGRNVIRAEGERNLLIKQKELDQEKLYRNISFAIAAFIIILGAVVFFFYRREQNQKKELAQLNATKDRLFAILSHDLQSPIANLQTFMNLIQWGALDQTEFAESTDSFSSQLGNVRTMLENVLNWSISQMGGLKPKFEICNIHQIIEQELELLNLTAKSKEIKIINSINTGIEIRADKNHLAFIFRNLIQNSLKFTNSGGNISLNCTESTGKKVFEVADDGIGMSVEIQKTLFNIEKSSSKIGTNAEKGTGLGLIIVKELVEANNGQINVESQEDVGTIFSLTF